MPSADPELNALIASFKAPVINDSQDGWGPAFEPDQFKDLPYQKFSKSDKIGKIADWSGASHLDKKNYNRYQPQFSVGNVGQYSYFHEEDESQFTLVDTTKTVRTQYQKVIRHQFQNKNKNKMQFSRQMQNLNNPKTKIHERTKQQTKNKRYTNTRSDNSKNQKQREPSVPVKEDWRVIEEIEFSRLTKLSLPLSADPQDLKTCGSLEYYDKTYDRLSTKNAKKLVRVNRVYHNVTTTDDPIIRQLAKTDGNVFATESIITTLMCCSRSANPWDIVVSKVKNKLFFDTRDGSNFDLLTVSETSTDPPVEDDANKRDINSANKLALEATYINYNFSQQVLRMNEERYKFPEPNPFFTEGDEGEVASVAYRYRKWNLGDGINLVVRSELNGVTHGPNDEIQFLNIKALNEWDSRFSNGIDWRSKIDGQPGAVLASEIKNNGCKLAKWIASTLLSGADLIKIGFVSRSNVRATDKHVVLCTQQFKPYDFATQIALNMDNAWGIVRCIIDYLMRQEDGKYIIMKDPNKQMIRIYSIPQNAFSDDEQDGDDDGNDDEANEDD